MPEIGEMATPAKFYRVEPGDTGSHVQGYGRALAKANRWWEAWLKLTTKQTWGWWHKRAVNKLKKQLGLVEDGIYTKPVHVWLVNHDKFDARSVALIDAYDPPLLPDLGPVVKGDKSILDYDFTHMTTNLGWPAFDAAFSGDPGPSITILAPEDMIVDTRDSSASPGEAFYATGIKSGIRYWFAHLKSDWPLGKKFAKGDVVGATIPTSIGGGTHLHLAINLVPVTGKHARYGADGDGPNYTHGPYTLRRELLRP